MQSRSTTIRPDLFFWIFQKSIDATNTNFFSLQILGPLGSTFEIGTQIILLQIDGFLQRLDLKYHPSNKAHNSLVENRLQLQIKIPIKHMPCMKWTWKKLSNVEKTFCGIPLLHKHTTYEVLVVAWCHNGLDYFLKEHLFFHAPTF